MVPMLAPECKSPATIGKLTKGPPGATPPATVPIIIPRIPDSDPTTTTDPLNKDSDNDGSSDGEEDANFNGALDSGETDPTVFNRLNAMPWLPLLLD